MKIEVHPLTRARWKDLVDLFNRPGGSIVRGCWCMYYRRTGSSARTSAEGNKRALASLVKQRRAPGSLLTKMARRLAGSPSRPAKSTYGSSARRL